MTPIGDEDACVAILVVDDEPTIAEIVCRYLEQAGYATRTASDGVQALALAAERRPDLVVLDVTLRGVGGLEVMRRLLSVQADGPRWCCSAPARGSATASEGSAWTRLITL